MPGRKGLHSNKAPGLCLAAGCTGKAIYRGRLPDRGYCFKHKAMALQSGITPEVNVEHQAEWIEEKAAKGNTWTVDVDDEVL